MADWCKLHIWDHWIILGDVRVICFCAVLGRFRTFGPLPGSSHLGWRRTMIKVYIPMMHDIGSGWLMALALPHSNWDNMLLYVIIYKYVIICYCSVLETLCVTCMAPPNLSQHCGWAGEVDDGWWWEQKSKWDSWDDMYRLDCLLEGGCHHINHIYAAVLLQICSAMTGLCWDPLTSNSYCPAARDASSCSLEKIYPLVN